MYGRVFVESAVCGVDIAVLEEFLDRVERDGGSLGDEEKRGVVEVVMRVYQDVMRTAYVDEALQGRVAFILEILSS
jgi:hypothetical protein